MWTRLVDAVTYLRDGPQPDVVPEAQRRREADRSIQDSIARIENRRGEALARAEAAHRAALDALRRGDKPAVLSFGQTERAQMQAVATCDASLKRCRAMQSNLWRQDATADVAAAMRDINAVTKDLPGVVDELEEAIDEQNEVESELGRADDLLAGRPDEEADEDMLAAFQAELTREMEERLLDAQLPASPPAETTPSGRVRLPPNPARRK